MRRLLQEAQKRSLGLNHLNKTFLGFGKNVFVTGLVSFFMDVSSEMIYPLVPLFLSNVLGANKSLIGLIEGIAESTASLLKVFSGWFSDRIGRRKGLMAAGYAISTLSRPLMAMAGGWRQVLGSRFMDRFGKGVRTSPRDAIIAESADQRYLGRAFGFHRSMDTMGAVVGPTARVMLDAATRHLRLVGLHALLGFVSEGPLGGQEEDGHRGTERCAAAYRTVVPVEPALPDRRAVENAVVEAAWSLRLLRNHREHA